MTEHWADRALRLGAMEELLKSIGEVSVMTLADKEWRFAGLSKAQLLSVIRYYETTTGKNAKDITP